MVPRRLHPNPLIFAFEMPYVLVMEVDRAFLESITQLLLEHGFDVKQAMESGEALSAVMEREPRVILLAEEMPSMDGMELLPLLRRVTRAPIVVLGSGGEAAVVKALLQGADIYLTRPVNHPELISRVRAFFRRSEAEPGERPSGNVSPHVPWRTWRGSTHLSDLSGIAAYEVFVEGP